MKINNYKSIVIFLSLSTRIMCGDFSSFIETAEQQATKAKQAISEQAAKVKKAVVEQATKAKKSISNVFKSEEAPREVAISQPLPGAMKTVTAESISKQIVAASEKSLVGYREKLIEASQQLTKNAETFASQINKLNAKLSPKLASAASKVADFAKTHPEEAVPRVAEFDSSIAPLQKELDQMTQLQSAIVERQKLISDANIQIDARLRGKPLAVAKPAVPESSYETLPAPLKKPTRPAPVYVKPPEEPIYEELPALGSKQPAAQSVRPLPPIPATKPAIKIKPLRPSRPINLGKDLPPVPQEALPPVPVNPTVEMSPQVSSRLAPIEINKPIPDVSDN